MKKIILSLVSLAAFSSMPIAQATIIEATYGGNDCAGYFGTGFDSCQVFADENGTEIQISPVIAKFNDLYSKEETNDMLFPSVDGSEWMFTTTSGNPIADWNYTPGAGDPGIRYWAAKAANQFTLYWEIDAADISLCGGGNKTLDCMSAALVVTSGSFDKTSLSHITFYDSVDPVHIPLPGTLALFLIGLIGLGAAQQKKTA